MTFVLFSLNHQFEVMRSLKSSLYLKIRIQVTFAYFHNCSELSDLSDSSDLPKHQASLSTKGNLPYNRLFLYSSFIDFEYLTFDRKSSYKEAYIRCSPRPYKCCDSPKLDTVDKFFLSYSHHIHTHLACNKPDPVISCRFDQFFQ